MGQQRTQQQFLQPNTSPQCQGAGAHRLDFVLQTVMVWIADTESFIDSINEKIHKGLFG